MLRQTCGLRRVCLGNIVTGPRSGLMFAPNTTDDVMVMIDDIISRVASHLETVLARYDHANAHNIKCARLDKTTLTIGKLSGVIVVLGAGLVAAGFVLLMEFGTWIMKTVHEFAVY